MKKCLALILAMMMLTAYTNVSAEIPVNDGKGLVLEFDKLVKNSPGGGSETVISEETDDLFGIVYQYAYDGNLTNTNLQFSLTYTNPVTASKDSYYYFSFYYRFVDDDIYDMPNSFVRRPNVNNNSGQSSLGAPSDVWKKVSFIATNTAEISSSTTVQMKLIPFITAGTPICFQVAKPECVYYGNVIGEGDLTPQQVIESELEKCDIERVYIDGNGFETSLYPDEYFGEILWESDVLPEITADTYISGSYEVTCDSDTLPAKYTITSYALNYDVLEGTGNKSAYVINLDYQKAGAFIDVNNRLVDDDYEVATDDVVNITYQLYNYGETAEPCVIILAFKNGNAFKDIITWNISGDVGVTDDMVSYTVTGEELAGCTVSAYVISNGNMTVIN